jgi:predicted phage baseplate assembly protein
MHGDGLGSIPDRRTTRIYEISGDDLAFRDFDYPKRASGDWIVVPLRPGEDANDETGFGALKKGRRILLSGGGRHHAAHVTTTLAVPTEPGQLPDHVAVGFAPPLPETRGPITLLGNIATASHGETQREDALGNGNAALPFQSFAVPPGDISHLPEAAGIRPVPQVELRVGDILWNEVPYLFGHGIKERVYTLNIRSDADPVISGGDGIRAGARFPTGALNVRLTRRLGAGIEGNLQPGQLSIALAKPVGLKGVTNPLATSGGAPGEANARQSAPNGVRTFGRIVSLADFESLATASGLVARAHVTWVWNRLERTVHLTVAGPAGAPLSVDNLALLHAQLTASRDPNRPLLIANLVRVPIAIAAKLSVDPAYSEDAVTDAARAALLDAFAPESIGIGQAVRLSGIYAILQAVAGVRAADIDLLHLKHHAELSPDERAVRSVTSAAVQTHIRLYSARPLPADAGDIDRYQRAAFEPGPPPIVLPAEQAYIADGALDVTLTAVGAL